MSQNSRNQGFSFYFRLMIEGSGAGSIPLTSGWLSGRPKNMWIRTDPGNGLKVRYLVSRKSLVASCCCVPVSQWRKKFSVWPTRKCGHWPGICRVIWSKLCRRVPLPVWSYIITIPGTLRKRTISSYAVRFRILTDISSNTLRSQISPIVLSLRLNFESISSIYSR